MTHNSNYTTEGGLHDGGVSYGEGFCISWQRGSLAENGRNGAFLIEVLEACKTQLEYHQDSQFACSENEDALANLSQTLEHLRARLNRRISEEKLSTSQV